MDRRNVIGRRPLVAAVAWALAGTPALLSVPSAFAQDVELGSLGDRGFRIDGRGGYDYSGRSVSGAGDVNGDGLADVIVGAARANPGSPPRLNAGESYLVFGKSNNAGVDLLDLGGAGFVVEGAVEYDNSGRSVSGAGDVNGDGLADLIVGAADAGEVGDYGAGETYVVFGKADSTAINAGALGNSGFRIDGGVFEGRSGFSVSGAGDVNGDGLADLIVGAPFAGGNGPPRAGESYVVFGKADHAPVALGSLGAGGFRIEGVVPGGRLGTSVSGAGDVNGDGLADLIVGAPNAPRNEYDPRVGQIYVVFGKPDTSPVDLINLGAGGFRLDGIGEFDVAGTSVSGAGDVNGDGLADLIIGAPGNDDDVGDAYVVFGTPNTNTLDLGNLGLAGFRIEGIDVDDRSGFSVSGAGDVNGDGLADLIVGAPAAERGDGFSVGESYIVFGKADHANIDLANLGSGGFRLNGIDDYDDAGMAVGGAGDVNGDGLADIIDLPVFFGPPIS